MGETYVGFYWTLPVPWAGFITLPKNAGEAAEASLTIRYQRDLTQRWVRNEGGVLIREEAFLETEPDRGSPEIAQEAVKLLLWARAQGAVLLWVDFASEGVPWRAHGWLRQALRKALAADPEGALCVPLDTIPLEGRPEIFDPLEHFKGWRDQQKRHMASKSERRALILSYLEAWAGAPLAARVEALKQAGLTTPTGKHWTAENLRKFLKAADKVGGL